jgi:hypothetical protein
VSASAFLYSIAAVLVTALPGALGWVLRDWVRIRTDEGKKNHRIAQAEETAQRILKEKESVEKIHANRPVSDLDNSERL